MTSEQRGQTRNLATSSSQKRSSAIAFREANRMKVTIKMLTDAVGAPRDQGRLVVNHNQVYTVAICGLLIAVDQSEAFTDFAIYDGTSSVKGRIWARGEDGHTDLSGSTYYMIDGTLSVVDGELRLDALYARELMDHNQVTEHMLSVILEHLQLEERYKAKTQVVPSATTVAIDMDKEGVIWFLSEQEIRKSEAGASEAELMEYLNIEEAKFRDVLEGLINEGIIYNTIDESHYKLAEN